MDFEDFNKQKGLEDSSGIDITLLSDVELEAIDKVDFNSFFNEVTPGTFTQVLLRDGKMINIQFFEPPEDTLVPFGRYPSEDGRGIAFLAEDESNSPHPIFINSIAQIRSISRDDIIKSLREYCPENSEDYYVPIELLELIAELTVASYTGFYYTRNLNIS